MATRRSTSIWLMATSMAPWLLLTSKCTMIGTASGPILYSRLPYFLQAGGVCLARHAVPHLSGLFKGTTFFQTPVPVARPPTPLLISLKPTKVLFQPPCFTNHLLTELGLCQNQANKPPMPSTTAHHVPEKVCLSFLDDPTIRYRRH